MASMTSGGKRVTLQEFAVMIAGEPVAGADAGTMLENWSQALLAVAAAEPIQAPVATWGGLAGPGVRTSVAAASAVEASGIGVRAFERALKMIGLSSAVARVEVVAEWLADAQVEAGANEDYALVGVTEVAEMLGVSRQRVSVLRTRDDFPRPVADLAAGPVWQRGSLRFFLEGWARKPGRPQTRVSATG